MQAPVELVDAWADLVYGSACVGCEMPGRPWCSSCARMLGDGLEPIELDVGVPGLPGACMGEYDGWLRAMILAHKEHSAWSLVGPLGKLLAHAVLSIADRAQRITSEDAIVLVPIPSRRSTVRRRGHDPSRRMARSAAVHLRSTGLDARALPLLRLRFPVHDSVGLSAVARRRNLDDAFAVESRARAALQRMGEVTRIVICDDVMTTGATAREAWSALTLAGIPAAGVATVCAVPSPVASSGRKERDV